MEDTSSVKLNLYQELVECFLAKSIKHSFPTLENTKELVRGRLKKVLFNALFRFYDMGFTEVSMECSLRALLNEMKASGKCSEVEKVTNCVKELPHQFEQLQERYQIVVRFLIALSSINDEDAQLSTASKSEVVGVRTSLQDTWHDPYACKNNAEMMMYPQEIFENDMQLITSSDAVMINLLSKHHSSMSDVEQKSELNLERLCLSPPVLDAFELNDENADEVASPVVFHGGSLPSSGIGNSDSVSTGCTSSGIDSLDGLLITGTVNSDVMSNVGTSSGHWSSDSISVPGTSCSSVLTAPLSPVSVDTDVCNSFTADFNISDGIQAVIPKGVSCDDNMTEQEATFSSSFPDLSMRDDNGFGFPNEPIALTWEHRSGCTVDEEKSHYITEVDTEAFKTFVSNSDMLKIKLVNCVPSWDLLYTEDVKMLLIGMSTNSFVIRKAPEGVKISFGPRLCEFAEYFRSPLAKLFEICHLYTRLKTFSEFYNIVHPRYAVINAMRFAVQEYLRFYESNLLGADFGEFQPIECFQRVFYDLESHLRYLCEFCDLIDGIYERCMGGNTMTTGVHLLSILYQTVDRDLNRPYCINLTPLFKCCFQVYFSFLEHWLFCGSIHESISEFNIKVHEEFALAEDETFWTNYFTYDKEIDDTFSPLFMKEIATTVFICGKSYYLLRRCCPNHPLFAADPDLPIFFLGFSESRISEIERKNITRMTNKIKAVLKNLKISDGVDEFLSGSDSTKKLSKSIPACQRKSQIGNFSPLKEELLFSLENMQIHNDVLQELDCLSIKKIDVVQIDELNEPEGKLVKNFQDIQNKYFSHFPTGDTLVSMLGNSIALYLNDDWGNEKDVFEYLQKEHISDSLNRSVMSLVHSQINLVNRCVLEFFFKDQKLFERLEDLTKFFFLRDGSFGLSLCQGIASEARKTKTSDSFCSPVALHKIFQQAFPDYANHSCEQITLNAVNIPKSGLKCELGAAEHLQLSYTVGFPCNIVITEKHMTIYNTIFVFLLQFQLSSLRLGEMWFHLKNLSVGKSAIVNSSPQFRKLQLCRHEMLHFVHAVRGFVHYQMLDVEWEAFQADLHNNAKNVEDLRSMHDEYICNSLKLCLLSTTSSQLRQLFTRTLNSIVVFCHLTTNNEWIYIEQQHQWIHPHFAELMSIFQCFKSHEKTLLQVLVALFHELGLLESLENFLLMFNFNLFYDDV